MYRLANETQEIIRAMVRHGYSSRKISRLAGVSGNTARRYINQFLDWAPICNHDRPIYKCSTCGGGHRYTARNIPRDNMTAYEVCLEALREYLNDPRPT